MEMCSTFDADEIKRLGKRFRKLDLDNSGSLSIDEFMSLPELQQNPLVQRVIDIFDTDGNGEVDFKEFIQGVSQFSVKGDKESKLKCKCTIRTTIYDELTYIGYLCICDLLHGYGLPCCVLYLNILLNIV